MTQRGVPHVAEKRKRTVRDIVTAADPEARVTDITWRRWQDRLSEALAREAEYRARLSSLVCGEHRGGPKGIYCSTCGKPSVGPAGQIREPYAALQARLAEMKRTIDKRRRGNKSE